MDQADGYGKGWDPAQHYQDVKIARDYDKSRFSSPAGRVYNWLERRLIRRGFADLPRDAMIADVPCGTGRLAEAILEMGFSLTGIDIAPPMLVVAGERLSRFGNRFRPVIMDVRQLAESDMRFDAVLCARVLMHFPLAEQIEFLRNVTTLAKRRVVFTQGLDTPYHRQRRALKRSMGHQPPAVYPLTRSMMRELIAGAGLREIRRYTLLPIISESVVVVCEPLSASRTGA